MKFRKENAIQRNNIYICPRSRAQTKAGKKGAEGHILCTADWLSMESTAREYGSGNTVYRTFQNWLAAGFFEKIWAKGLEQYDELEGIGWEWQSLDGCMIKAPLALESVGKNPTDRGKDGNKTQCANG